MIFLFCSFHIWQYASKNLDELIKICMFLWMFSFSCGEKVIIFCVDLIINPRKTIKGRNESDNWVSYVWFHADSEGAKRMYLFHRKDITMILFQWMIHLLWCPAKCRTYEILTSFGSTLENWVVQFTIHKKIWFMHNTDYHNLLRNCAAQRPALTSRSLLPTCINKPWLPITVTTLPYNISYFFLLLTSLEIKYLLVAW